MRLLIFFLLMVQWSICFGQVTILEKFQARLVNDEVILTWTIIQGSTCNGIDLTRSLDGINFIKIGQIDGICGSLSEAVPYTLLDKNPSISINYYRLELGGVGPSEIISIQVFNFGEEGYVVQPNPFVTNTKIYFKNDRNELFKLSVYGVNGSVVLNQVSNTNFFELDKQITSTGLYVFVITKNEGDFNAKGKILRQ